LDRLVGQLLTLSRIESRVESVTAPVDLANLLDEVAGDADFEARAQGKRVEVTAASPCVVPASEELLRSALENVIRNAVRYTAKGTSVEVSLECAENARIRVRDHGPGVPPEELTEIFRPFHHSGDGNRGTCDQRPWRHRASD
jgi:signal transduction histidine kinase